MITATPTRLGKLQFSAIKHFRSLGERFENLQMRLILRKFYVILGNKVFVVKHLMISYNRIGEMPFFCHVAGPYLNNYKTVKLLT